MVNQNDRRDYDIAASQNAQDNFNRVAAQLEAVIDQHDRDVAAAMADYTAEGVSEDYRAKEQRWKAVRARIRARRRRKPCKLNIQNRKISHRVRRTSTSTSFKI